ncbi:MAG: type II toxin-antitoxin system RelE/ParE family toxin [Bacteroidia bacterium]|jgi:plasmid stabilization system protein ParE
MVSINWTEQAKNDLVSIAGFIAQDSVKYARITVQNIRTSVIQLRKYPRSGRLVPEASNENIRELIHGNYRIINWLKDVDRIDILTVHHSSMLLFVEELREHTR